MRGTATACSRPWSSRAPAARRIAFALSFASATSHDREKSSNLDAHNIRCARILDHDAQRHSAIDAAAIRRVLQEHPRRAGALTPACHDLGVARREPRPRRRVLRR